MAACAIPCSFLPCITFNEWGAPDSASLTGASFCRVDVSDDEEFDNIEPYELDSAGYIDLNNAVSVGKDRIDGSSILTYY